MDTSSNLTMMQTDSSHHGQYPANHDDGFSLPSNKDSSSVTNSISAYKYPWMRPEFTSASVHKCRRSSGYTCYQLHELENEFRMNRYLTCVKRTELSQRIGLTERQIKIWFQAHRLQWKRERCKSLITFYVQPEANTTNHDQNHQSSAISTNYTAA